MTYPRDAGELEEFTPASLKNIPSPPIFLIRAATPRDKRRTDKLIVREGLRHHSTADIRAETLRGIKANWSEDIFSEQEGRINAYWDALDQYNKQTDGQENPDPFEHPDQTSMEKLSRDIYDIWQPLRDMAADNGEFNEVWPSLTASVLLAGWSGLDVAFTRDAGKVPLDTLDDVSEALAEIERKYGDGKVDGVASPGTAMAQLYSHCANAIYLDKAAEKNSASPSKSASTPAISKTDGQESGSGSSMAQNTSETHES